MFGNVVMLVFILTALFWCSSSSSADEVTVTERNSEAVSQTTGLSVWYRIWEVSEPRGYIFLVHGMAEHSGRYSEFAEWLARELSVTVVAHDHKGHGRTACGDISETDNCLDLGKLYPRDYSGVFGDPGLTLAKDLELVVTATVLNKKTPLFFFGHSMGSVITRILLTHTELSETMLQYTIGGIILSGVPTAPTTLEYWALAPVAYGIHTLGNLGHETFVDFFVTGKFDSTLSSKLKENVPKNGFISSIPAKINSYNKDRFCGHLVELPLLVSVAGHLLTMQQTPMITSNLYSRPRVLIICGRHDPVCNFGETAKSDAAKLASMGYVVDEIYLGNSRHEFLQEDEVVRGFGMDIVRSWLQQRLTVTETQDK